MTHKLENQILNEWDDTDVLKKMFCGAFTHMVLKNLAQYKKKVLYQ